MTGAKVVVLLVVAMGIFGCSGADGVGNANEKPPSQADIDKQIKEIDANPNIPPQAKAIQKGMLQKGGTGQKSQGPTK